MSAGNLESENARNDTSTAFELKLKQIDSKKFNIELQKIEHELANELRSFCDNHGKETINNLQASALVLHKIGQVYHKRAPDMLSLIRSAALYNAALARHPANKQEVQDDLKQLCFRILSLANAKHTAVDLIKHAETVKLNVLEMRKKVAQTLHEIKEIPDSAYGKELHSLEQEKILSVQKLQNQVTANFKQTMENLARFCEELMGEAPCKFALIGMGSLARREVTPFSDFESMILLENEVQKKESYQKTLNYFRWFSVIFQIVLINLQETIIPSVAIFSLNWFFDSITPSGISFDGMMPHACKSPLGRQQPTELKPWTTELIKPIDQMLQYLSIEENLKNGYHLSEILSKTCFVYNDSSIYAEFQKGVVKIIENEENKDSLMKSLKTQVVDDLQSFATRFSLSTVLKPNQQFNVKKVVYRSTTLFISALGRLYNDRSASCFDIITELHAKQRLSNYAKHKLMFAVVLACEIRLRWYLQAKKQWDNIDSVHALIQLVGRKSITSYFQIAYALQCDISKRLNLKQEHFYSFPTLLNLSLAHCFEDENLMSKILSFDHQDIEKQWLYDFDQCLKILENQTEHNSIIEKEMKQKSSLPSKQEHWEQFQTMGDLLLIMSCIDDAIECFQKSTELIEKNIQNQPKQHYSLELKRRNWQRNISFNYQRIGYLQTMMYKYQESEQNLKMSLTILQNLSPGADVNRQMAITLRLYGQSLTQSNKLEEAKQALDRSFKIGQLNIDSDYDTSCILRDLGRCLLKMNKLKKAKNYLCRSLRIKKRILPDVYVDREVSVTMHELGCCLMKMNELEKAEYQLSRSLQIAERISSAVDSDREVYLALHELGRCFMKMNKLERAREYLYKSLQIKTRISSDVDSDRDVSTTLHELGRCLIIMNKLEEAKHYLDRSLQIAERISSDVNSDREVYLSLHELGRCLMKINQFEEAKIYLDRSLQIVIRISSNPDTDRDISITRHVLGRCLMEMSKLKEAKTCLETSLQIKERISSGVDSDHEVSTTLHELGRCSLKSNELEEAKRYLERSLQITVHISADVDCDNDVYLTLHELGRCLMKMNELEEAKYHLDRSLQIKKRISSDANSDGEVALTQLALGRCLMKMNLHEEAKYHFDRSLQITGLISSYVDSDREICLALHELGCCSAKMKQFENAKTYFNRSLQIKERISSDIDSDREVSATLYELGRCLMEMNELEEAKNILKRSLQIADRISSDVDSNLAVSVTLHKLGRCLMKMNKFEEAKSYLDRSLQIAVDFDGEVSFVLHEIDRCTTNMNEFK